MSRFACGCRIHWPSGDSLYDRFVAGDRAALSAAEQAGLQVFRGRGNCTACHIGPNFSDEEFHNTGVAWSEGRFADTGAGHGEFKTPTLREVARTSPYMHDGSLTTLEQVVDYYDRGGNANPWLDPETGISLDDQSVRQGLLSTESQPACRARST